MIVAGIAGPRQPDGARFAAAVETRADLEEPHVAPAVPPIVRDGVDEAGDERRTQRVEFRRQRIRDRDRRRVGWPEAERVGCFRFDEAERDRLGEPGGRQDTAHEAVARDPLVGAAPRRS